MGVEGLELTPPLIISKTNKSTDRGMLLLLIDRDTATCVEVNVSSDLGKFYLRKDLHCMRFAMRVISVSF